LSPSEFPICWVGRFLLNLNHEFDPRDIKRRLDKTLRLTNDAKRRLDKTLRIIGGDKDRIRNRANSIKQRIDGAIGGNKKSDENIIYTTGRVFMFVTQSQSHGEEDFKKILSKQKIKPRFIIERLESTKYRSKSLCVALRKKESKFRAGDIIAIVRGGGDTTTPQFSPYKSKEACDKLREVADKFGVITVTGIGHTGDAFPIDKAADYPQETPTDAAYRVALLISGQITI
jgi:hypothetical protein